MALESTRAPGSGTSSSASTSSSSPTSSSGQAHEAAHAGGAAPAGQCPVEPSPEKLVCEAPVEPKMSLNPAQTIVDGAFSGRAPVTRPASGASGIGAATALTPKEVPDNQKAMHCPFMRTMVSAPDHPTWDPNSQLMEYDDLTKFVKDQPGEGDMQRVLKFFAVVNHTTVKQHLMNLFSPGARFSTHLMGSRGDHTGGSHIYDQTTGLFDRAKFQAFVSASRDGKTLTVQDLGRAIAQANHDNGGKPIDIAKSAGEFALLGILLGDSSGTIKIRDMEQLFARNEFPAGARENLGSRTAKDWIGLTVKISTAATADSLPAHLRHAPAALQDIRKHLEELARIS